MSGQAEAEWELMRSVPWDSLHRTPEMRWLSGNACPGTGPMFIRGWECSPFSLTHYGYCLACWSSGKVPGKWAARVAATKGRNA